MDKFIILIALLIGATLGFVIGTSIAISSIDNTIQAIQEDCQPIRETPNTPMREDNV